MLCISISGRFNPFVYAVCFTFALCETYFTSLLVKLVSWFGLVGCYW